MEDLKKISVQKNNDGTELDVFNPTPYKLIGKGLQGAVFKVSDDRCVKVYVDEKYCTMERNALEAGQNSNIVPHMFEVGPNYIVMEYINGESLRDYLEKYTTFPYSMTKRILSLFHQMEKVGYKRIDANLRHIYVVNGGLKVIDHVNSLSINRTAPIKFLKGLRKRRLMGSFLEQVKELDYERYSKWKKALREHYGIEY
ncbi:kinase [Terrilactibacillus laevilacticus]|uniref:Kinase n=1 Tax=Terrilactibacillus laevilacticus TaxID=1380157 RepID=A0ABW5PNC6_9BACI|nr:kinase [Terrilactibacillus laevilacticus]